MSDWFRNSNWDPETEKDFFRRLSRARAHNRTQYRRIKAGALLAQPTTARLAGARKLLTEALVDSSAPAFEKRTAMELLAKEARLRGDLGEAERHLRALLQNSLDSRSGTSSPELTLAEVLVEQEKSLPEVERLLDRAADDPGAQFLSVWRFRIAAARARLAALSGERGRAQSHAREALAEAARSHSGLPRHPTVGLVARDDPSLPELRRWATESDAEG